MGPARLEFSLADEGLEAVVRGAEGDKRAFLEGLWGEVDPSGNGEGVEWIIKG